jgi:hypothetical protein
MFYAGIIFILFTENEESDEESNEDVVFPEISEENQPRGYRARQNAVEDIFASQVKCFFLFQLFCFVF